MGYNVQKDKIMISDSCHVLDPEHVDGLSELHTLAVAGKILVHSCDLLNGVSGGPLILKDHHQYLVIGVQSHDIQPDRGDDWPMRVRGRWETFSIELGNYNVAVSITPLVKNYLREWKKRWWYPAISVVNAE